MEKIYFLSLILILGLLVHYFMACCSAITTTRTNLTTDQSTLLTLKTHINFEPHNVFLANNWSTTTSCCNWIGVTCGIRHQRVTALNLANMDLTGTIPPHLANLSFLASLNIRNNTFKGYLPDELSSLRRLKNIHLRFNNFIGELPSWFGRLPQLQILELANNNFSGPIPPSLCNISTLEVFYIQNNHIHGYIPKEINWLASLKNLLMYGNHLSGSIPSSVYNMSSLQLLVLASNSLSGSLPTDMCNQLPELCYLNLEDNELNGQFPSTIHKCKSLQILSISYNNFTGNISKKIGNLTMLKELYVGSNDFKGAIPEELGGLHNLEILDLQFNNLSGSIPSNIFNISSLAHIGLTYNQLSGQLPPTIGVGLPNLKEFYLGGNKVSGTIPSSISNASKLTELDLGENLFTGVIPNTLGNLRLLEWLSLGSNSLITEPSTPYFNFLTSLTNCQQMRFLDLSDNLLNDIFPISIGNLSNSLVEFDFNDCNIKGNIPSEIGNLSNLILFDLGGNELTGVIPPTVGRLQNLQVINFSNNKLQGSVPYDLCHLRRLFGLYLSGNELSGPIPACIGNLTSLRKLYLNSNKFISSIPSALWSLTNILNLYLSSNSLSSTLPLDIVSLKAVIDLDLSRNHLLGNIPSSIGSLQSLFNLSLAHNRLQGPIPDSFKDLISLEFLDLSNNNLSGVIPKSLEKLTYLKSLNVSFNSLSGEIPDGGPFTNIFAQSFMMNDALCGAPRLQVPPCRNATPRRSRKTVELIVKFGLPTVVVILVLIYFLIKCQKRKVAIPAQTDLSHKNWIRISHHELLQATNGFIESNLLGNGSYGSVYKGMLSNGVIVAVKVFNLQLEGALKSFDVECEVLRNVRHRNLIKIISSCSNNLDFKALLLEYMPNSSLEKWVYSHNYFLDILQRLNIMIDVALALEYLHHNYSTPIVHCDLKPNNILLDDDMVAHVGDFGISKLLGEGEFIKQTMTLATIGYMAPEYGAEGIVSTRGDVYSYGIRLMEVFTRKKPTDEAFAGEMNFKRWVSDSLHGSIIEVVDSNLLKREDEHFLAKEHRVLAAFSLALECTADLPEERINMENVVVELVKTKNTFVAHNERS